MELVPEKEEGIFVALDWLSVLQSPVGQATNKSVLSNRLRQRLEVRKTAQQYTCRISLVSRITLPDLVSVSCHIPVSILLLPKNVAFRRCCC